MISAHVTYPSGTPHSWNVPLLINARLLRRQYRRCHVTRPEQPTGMPMTLPESIDVLE